MACPRFAVWLLTRADVSGSREALVGDLLEEIGRGRSRCWVWQQVIGLCAFTLVAHARTHARVTPHVVLLVLGVVLLGGVSIASLDSVLSTWVGFYFAAGILSLFAQVMSRTIDSRTLVISGAAEDAELRQQS